MNPSLLMIASLIRNFMGSSSTINTWSMGTMLCTSRALRTQRDASLLRANHAGHRVHGRTHKHGGEFRHTAQQAKVELYAQTRSSTSALEPPWRSLQQQTSSERQPWEQRSSSQQFSF